MKTLPTMYEPTPAVRRIIDPPFDVRPQSGAEAQKQHYEASVRLLKHHRFSQSLEDFNRAGRVILAITTALKKNERPCYDCRLYRK